MKRKEYRSLLTQYEKYNADSIKFKDLERFYDELYVRAERLRVRLLWGCGGATDDANKHMKRNLYKLTRVMSDVINELNYECDGRNVDDMKRHCMWLNNVVYTLATF